ncbi:MAG: ATP-binding protein [Fusobacteriaceae bacterium]|jgi:predicted AAA+ superfamily ATPase|nr:ATP-binding protein [Fusobacteriaceae bacterium]
MVERKIYMEKLLNYKDTEFVKVITGIRRCGKSTLLKFFVEYLLKEDKDVNLIYMNFESFEFDEIKDYREMYKKITDKIKNNRKAYIFLDEIQRVKEWEKCVNALMVDFDCDIYITGSNAYLLSSELSTYLSGRYVEINMFPLSFKEFLEFFSIEENLSLEDKFSQYIKFGGMPGIMPFKYKEDLYENTIKGVYYTVFIKDILEKNKMTNATLLEKVLKFIMNNIGSTLSSKKIADYLTSQGNKVTHNTILNYIEMLQNAYIIYKAQRYDIKGKNILKTLEKYYIVDTGIRNSVLGFRNDNIGYLIENIVYFQLVRLGYDVKIGKLTDLEVDFVATKHNDIKYYQVTMSMLDENVRKRETESLRKIRDNHEKIILTLDRVYSENLEDGIKCKNLIDFLMEE